MAKQRFFATLAFARKIVTQDKPLRDVLVKVFHYGYTCGWKDKGGEAHAMEVHLQ